MTAAIGTLFGGGEMLSIDRIRRDPRTQPRNHINHEVVERYRDAMEAGDAFPPVTVFFDGEEYWLADGWHRVCAALCLGWQGIAAEIRQGGLREAEWHSFSVNGTHGYPRDKDDVSHILSRIFRDPEWSAKGLRAISRHCGIPWSTVQYKHGKFVSSGQTGQLGMKPSMREVTREDGTTYEMETRNIGRVSAPEPSYEPHPRQGCGNCKNSVYRPAFSGLECTVYQKQTHYDAIIGETCTCWEPDPEDEEFQLDEAPEPVSVPAARDPKFAFAAFPPEHALPAGRIRYLLNALWKELTLSPDEVLAASPWTDLSQLYNEATWVSDWLRRLLQKLPEEEDEK